MKLLLALCAIFCVASAADTLYLEIGMKKVDAKIDDQLLQTLVSVVPGLILSNVPDQYKTIADSSAKYVENVAVAQKYDTTTKVSNIRIYFPNVPASLIPTVQPFLDSYKNVATVTNTLAAFLPSYLNCGSCEYEGVSVGTDGSSAGPTPEKATGYIVGMQVVVAGIESKISDTLIATAKSVLPGLLTTQITKITTLTSQQAEILKKFVSAVDISQSLNAADKKLKVRITFPAIPSSYIELYKPVFQTYVIDNTALVTQIKTSLGTLIGCASCTVESIGLINEKKSAVATKNPTAKPTKQPTKQPTKKPTKQPTKQPTRQPTAGEGANGASSLSYGVGFLIAMAAVAI